MLYYIRAISICISDKKTKQKKIRLEQKLFHLSDLSDFQLHCMTYVVKTIQSVYNQYFGI